MMFAKILIALLIVVFGPTIAKLLGDWISYIFETGQMFDAVMSIVRWVFERIDQFVPSGLVSKIDSLTAKMDETLFVNVGVFVRWCVDQFCDSTAMIQCFGLLIGMWGLSLGIRFGIMCYNAVRGSGA